MKKICFILICLPAFIINSAAQSWQKVGIGIHGLNVAGGSLYAGCTDIHGNIYTCGELIDDSGGHSVYKWDGTSWNELGHGSSSLDPSAGQIKTVFADIAGNVYAPAFSQSLAGYYVARWDGAYWSPVGTGFPVASDISAIATDRHGNLYAAGGFHDASYRYFVAKWDGVRWSEVGTGSHSLNANAYINCMVVDTLDHIYVAGAFSNNASVTKADLYVAKWDGTNWSEVGGAVAFNYYHGENIEALAEDAAGNLYATGWFTNSNHKYYVAKWDGTTWSELGTGANSLKANNIIFSLCLDGQGNLYTTGSFTDTTVNLIKPNLDLTTGIVYTRDTIHPCYVAKWDGTTWSNTGIGVNALNANQAIYSICSDANGNIYAAGAFTDTTVIVPWLSPTRMHTDYTYPSYVAKYRTSITGVAPLALNSSMVIYPNPASNILTVTAHDNIANIEIYDAAARTVFSRQYNTPNVQVNVSDLPQGVYFIKMNGVVIRKFVKE
ncbi:MAG: T9SS type A sorting domain-containing protein [Taibaiella sp.]|nr:T9SS type A sorting domain-containing protein [Taibaiella sp.]